MKLPFCNFKPTVTVVLQRIWQAVAGLVTAVLVVHTLTPEAQGWYYSLLNAAAIFTLFDLGLSVILVQRSASLHTRLSLTVRGEPVGINALRFSGLAAFSYRWYRISALWFFVLLLPIGLYVFSMTNSGSEPQMWQLLWLCLILASAINLWLLPSLSLVEGGGHMASVYGLRLVQGVFGALVCWIVLLSGGGAWASLAVPLISAGLGLFWLFRRKPCLIILRYAQPQIDSDHPLWPQQWRLALTWIGGFALTQIYVPVLLAFNKPVEAGQLGLTLAIANMLAIISQSWLTSAYPRMSLSAAQRSWYSLRTIFWRALLISAGLYLVAIVVISLSLMHPLLSLYASRLLPIPIFLALLVGIFINQFCASLAAYIRASGREPFAWISLGTTFLTLLGAVTVVEDHGVNGLVLVILATQVLFALPLSVRIWYIQRKRIESGS